MAKRRTLEERLAALNELRDDPGSPTTVELVGKELNTKSRFVVAAAAQIVGEHEIHDFAETLVDAFGRFMTDPAKTDKGCRAKTAIAEALYRVGHDNEQVFLKGIRHVQMEPV